jgi:hypothetical protein
VRELLGLPYVTHRLFLTMEAWAELEWNQPGPLEQYIQLVATEVRRSYAKDPRKVKFEDLRLEFKRIVQQHPEDQDRLIEQGWLAFVGLKPEDIEQDGD